jgi:hypothetical protein
LGAQTAQTVKILMHFPAIYFFKELHKGAKLLEKETQ